MKSLSTLMLCLTLINFAIGTDKTGTITSNETWDIAGSPYIITGNVTIAAGVTVTVDPNVQVKFNNGLSIVVNGILNAINATFTTNDLTPAPGKWLVIDWNSGSSGNLLGCTFEYGRNLNIDNGASVIIGGADIHSMSYYGIYNNGTLNFNNSVINLAGWTNYGYGLYSDASGISNLNTVTILSAENGIYLNGLTQVNLTDVIVTSCNWPVYFYGTGALTTSGSCDFLGNTRNACYVFPASMTSNWTLPYVNVPYYFRTTFTVNNGTTLTIANNNILKFPITTALDIKGTLNANATSGNNIFFTSERDDNWGGDTNNDGTSTAPAVSNWYGIRFYNESNDASVMHRCKVRYAGAGNLGGVSLYDASPTIDLCEFQQNYFGAYFQNASSPNFSNNTIGSSSLTPIAMSFEANPTFTNNILSFMDNQYDAIGLLGGTLTASAHIIQRDFTSISNITYVMLAQITVPTGMTLTIDPGIVIKSSTESYRIIIQGKLVADGTETDYITFTSVKDDNFGNPSDTNKDGTITTPVLGDMGAIIFANGYDPTSLMDRVRMKYARAYNYYYSNGGQNHYIYASAVAVISSTVPSPAGPTITFCEFRDLNYGICCYQAANPVIANNQMINITSTPFAVSASANPTFIGNTFTNVGLRALGLVGHNVAVNGTIYKRDVAGYNNITYVLLENLTILNGANIEIDPGVVIKLDGKAIYIDGGLKTNGSSVEPVIFTSFKDDNVGNPMDTNGDGSATSPARGDWYYLEFRDVSNDLLCELNYTNLLYGGGSNSGIIRTISASPKILHVTINQSNYGLWFDGASNPICNFVDIQNCLYDPIGMSLTSDPTFANINFLGNGSSGLRLIDVTLSVDATLEKRDVAGIINIPYIIQSNLTIASGATLTIQPGIIIKFRATGGLNGIYNKGGLFVIGDPGEKIYFTSFKDDAVGGDTNNDGSSSIPGNDDWNGLIFYPESMDVNNKLIRCEIRYTGGGYSSIFGSSTINGAVRIKDAYVQISNTVFQQGYYSALGIYGSANPDISDCQIYNFGSEPVYMAMFSNPVFNNISVSNVGLMAIGIQPENYSSTATIPVRNFAGYNNITYIFYGATINSGTTITIPAGIVFKSKSSSYGFVVNGKLVVAGVDGNKVVFTDYRDDNYGNPADTEQNGSLTTPASAGPYIQFNDVSDDASTVNHLIMRYTTDAIGLGSASPSITNCVFQKLNYGIVCVGVSTPVIDNNLFNDLVYTPISISLVAYPASTAGNIISGTTMRCIRVNNETLTSDALLPKRSFADVVNIPYLFQTYTIGTGVTLTIAPGVVCKFLNAGSMTVNNGLIAEGIATNAGNIVFTSITDDFHGGDSNSDQKATGYGSTLWQGIIINDVAIDPLVRFENCIVRWASYNSNSAGIRTTSASPSILNCSFNNCYQGVQASAASNPVINYCDFYNITQNAVNNVNQSFVINAENCWWGSNTGPTHATNPGGTGEPVTNSVDFNPFGTNGTINPLMGDVSLNGIIQAFDASQVLQHVVAPFLNAKQQVVADVSGVAGINAMDASLILQFVVNLINYFPAELLLPGPMFQAEAELTIASETVEPGQEFSIPVSLGNASNIYALQANIHYDPEKIHALEVENLVPAMTMVYKIDKESGTIVIVHAGVEPLEGDLPVANLKVKALAGAGVSIETEIAADFFMANETDLSDRTHNGTIVINGFATGIPQREGVGSLHCYPNPFSSELIIEYQVNEISTHVNIGIYDMVGQLVAEIANGQHIPESYRLTWDGTDISGSRLKSGIYFLKMTSGNHAEIKKIQIVR